jgi:hypothetical protein
MIMRVYKYPSSSIDLVAAPCAERSIPDVLRFVVNMSWSLGVTLAILNKRPLRQVIVSCLDTLLVLAANRLNRNDHQEIRLRNAFHDPVSTGQGL